jgi:hypothetical protein
VAVSTPLILLASTRQIQSHSDKKISRELREILAAKEVRDQNHPTNIEVQHWSVDVLSGLPLD